MLNKVKLVFSNREVVLKLLITFALLLVFKIGTYIPIPLIDTTNVRALVQNNDFLTILNAFSGGGLSNFSILALGISPYITASIVIQMLQMIIPKFKEFLRMNTIYFESAWQKIVELNYLLELLETFDNYVKKQFAKKFLVLPKGDNFLWRSIKICSSMIWQLSP